MQENIPTSAQIHWYIHMKYMQSARSIRFTIIHALNSMTLCECWNSTLTIARWNPSMFSQVHPCPAKHPDEAAVSHVVPRWLHFNSPHFTRDAINIHIITTFNGYPDGINDVWFISQRDLRIRLTNIYRDTIDFDSSEIQKSLEIHYLLLKTFVQIGNTKKSPRFYSPRKKNKFAVSQIAAVCCNVILASSRIVHKQSIMNSVDYNPRVSNSIANERGCVLFVWTCLRCLNRPRRPILPNEQWENSIDAFVSARQRDCFVFHVDSLAN